jgi:hypothetical protein
MSARKRTKTRKRNIAASRKRAKSAKKGTVTGKPSKPKRAKAKASPKKKAVAEAKAKQLPPDLAVHRGGVSPRLRAPAIRGARTRKAKAAKQPGKFPNFTWQGGPVIATPEVHTTFWGALWSDASHQARAQRLNQYHQDLLQSEFMNVLSQYGVGQGAGKAGTFVGGTFIPNVPTTLTDPIIQQTIQSAIDRGDLAEPDSPSNLALIIYLDENIGINDPGDQLVLCEPSNDNAFGFHEFFTTSAGHKFYYAIIPGLSDACLQESCPGGDASCSLQLTQTQEQRQTQVASHEFAEMTTDPELNGWLDPQNGENGDICNGQSATITVGTNNWNVQSTYSKTDDIATNGQSFCRATAPSPIPPLKPGP